MNWLQAVMRDHGPRRLLWAGVGLALTGCSHVQALNPYAAGGINPDSTVAAETVAASHASGPYPHFPQIPAPPTDVRSVPAWRTAVVSETGVKRQTEHQAAALPFTLKDSDDTLQWAQRTRSKIPPGERSQPTPDTATQSEAFAAAERARATPPPPPQ